MSNLTPFDIAKIINTKSENIEASKDNYNIFMMNKIYSNTQDSVFYANEANAFTKNISEQMHFDFYYYGLSKASRYGKWHKLGKDADPDVIEYVQEYFSYSKEKAIESIACFDDETIEAIKADIKIMKKTVTRG